MSHPPSSYLTPEAVEQALGLARALRAAAEEIRRLVSGGPAGSGGGREADIAVALREWIGPHRRTFERLIANEMASARAAEQGLEDEADAWAAFWAEATNARRQRLHQEAVEDHRRALARYDDQLARYREAVATDPSSAIFLSAPHRPTAPTPPTLAPVPTAASDYRATG